MTLLDFFALAKHHMPAFAKHIDGFVSDITGYPELVGTATNNNDYNYIAPEPVEQLYEVIIVGKQESNFPDKTILHYEYWQGGPGKLYYETSAIRCMHKYVDLLIVTTSNVEEGEVYYLKDFKRLNTAPVALQKKSKIVFASCDISYEIPCPDGINGCEVLHTKTITKLSEAFIKKFIEDYNTQRLPFYTLEQILI